MSSEPAPASDPVLGVVPSVAPGRAFAVIGQDHGTVTLQGEIDLTLSEILSKLADAVRSLSAEVVVDATAVTFADSTLVNFLTELGQQPHLTLKASRVVWDLLAYSDAAVHPGAPSEGDRNG
jgi:hypothetical protein